MRYTKGRVSSWLRKALGLAAGFCLLIAGVSGWSAVFASALPGAANEQKVMRANYELASKFSENNLRQMIFDLTVVPNWILGTDMFWYRWETAAGAMFYLVDPGRKRVEPAFDHAAVAAELSRISGQPIEAGRLPIADFGFVEGLKKVRFAAGNAVFECDRKTGKVTKLSDAAGAVAALQFNEAQMKFIRNFTGGGTLKGAYLYSPDGRWAVFARNHNIFLIDTKEGPGKEYQMTKDGEPWYTFDFYNEDGKLKDAVNPIFVTWFADSSGFYFKRTDRRKVRELWLLQPLTRPYPTLRTYRNALAGDEFVDQYELWAFDCAKKSAVKIKAEKWPDQAIGGKAQDGGVYSIPGSRHIYFIRTDRTWSKIDFCEADSATGDIVRTLVSEEIKPTVTPTSSQVKVLSGGKEIIWWSNRDGWGHFYLYDDQGNIKNAITTGPYCSRSIVRVDEKTRTLFFTASGKEAGVNPYYEFLYRVGLDGKGLKCLTPENANHGLETLSISDSGRYFIDDHSRVDLAPEAVVRDMAGNKIMSLPAPDLSKLQAAGWKAPETFSVKAADDETDLYGVMWKPFDFDPALKYPVIMFTYPGPISEVVPKDFNPLGMPVTGMAQLGFVVVMFGNRGGSAERSKAYNDFGYGNLRDFGSADKKAGLEHLAAAYPFLDIDRIGVMGGSGGGFQTTTLMFTYPDFFKVGVCWAGNNDNSLMEAYWSELNQGVKEIHEDGRVRFEVKPSDVLDLAKNLKGHFLIMQGLQDARVHPAITYRVVQALIEANKPFDMYIIPDEQHQFTAAKYQPYILRVIWQYFAEHLMGDPRTKVEVFEKYGGPVTRDGRR